LSRTRTTKPKQALPKRARKETRLSRERREKLLKAATQLFWEKGFTATSMQDVSDAVGLLKGSLYYYVESKEELLFQVLQDLHHDGEQIIEAVDFDSGEPLEEFRKYLCALTIYAGENRDRLSIFFRDFQFVPADRQMEIIAERDMYESAALRLIESAKAKGQIDASLNSKVAAYSIVGATAITHVWYRPNGPVPLAQIGQQVASSLVDGLKSVVVKS
jgi:AcrR family transcriptional regulator